MEIVDNQICVLHLLVDMNEPNKLNTVLDKLMKVSEVVQAVRED
jgi:hypothetical protein